MPREAAPKRGSTAPVFRQISPDSHVFPHCIRPGGRVNIDVRGGLIGLQYLLRPLPRMERHLLFTRPDERGIKPDAALRTGTRRVR